MKLQCHILCLNYILLSQHPQDSSGQIVNKLMKLFERGSNYCLLLQLSQFIDLFLLKEVESHTRDVKKKSHKSHIFCSRGGIWKLQQW